MSVFEVDRTAGEILEWSRSLLDPALRAAVHTLPESMRHIAGYHFGWWDEDGRASAADGGKALRPALVLLAARATGGRALDALPAAVAVELVHNFSLLHDDVLDRDVTRRHRRTAWHVFGAGPAILAGDALLTLAFDVLASTDVPVAQEAMRTLGAAVQDLTDGQAADLAFERRDQIDLAECVRMAEHKTGALLGCSTAIGALFAYADAHRIKHLRGFGESLGLAFQFVDDLLGIWGDPEVTGKPVYADLRRRKKSLPVVAALTSGSEAGTELARSYRPAVGIDLVRTADLIDITGARAWCQAQADELFSRALDQLDQADPDRTAAAELTALARLATRRDH